MDKVENPDREHKDLQSEGWHTDGAQGAVYFKEGKYREGEGSFAVHILPLTKHTLDGLFRVRCRKWRAFEEEKAGQKTTWDKFHEKVVESPTIKQALDYGRYFIKEGPLGLHSKE